MYISMILKEFQFDNHQYFPKNRPIPEVKII